MAKQDKKAKPFPEAIDGRPWTIRESPTPRNAGVGDGLMVVPLGTATRERAVRLHETMHVKITDSEAMRAASRELPDDILQNCEDARVHGHLQRRGFEEELGAMRGVISDFEIEQIARHGHLAQIAAVSAATTNTGEWQRLANEIGDEETDEYWALHTGRKLASQNMFRPSELPSWETTVAMCRQIIELFGDPGRPEEPAAIEVAGGERVYSIAKELSKPSGPVMLKDGTKMHEDEAGFMPMEIVEPPLTVRLPQKMRMKPRKIPEAYGRRLRRVGRLYHDGRVFVRKLRKPGGGAVLIDVSGSMKLSYDDVFRLVQEFPGGVVATYCSVSDSPGGFGWLTVIARNGMRCEEHLMEPPGGGNGVDGPALDWIAKHPGPRFWVSDAKVHGGTVGLAYCLGVCLRHNITRVDNAQEILGRTP